MWMEGTDKENVGCQVVKEVVLFYAELLVNLLKKKFTLNLVNYKVKIIIWIIIET